MSELRKDPVTRRWVIIATERAKRPSDFVKPKPDSSAIPEYLDKCPFCEGNENQTPPELMSYRHAGTQKDSKGWWIRVVPNKYSAVSLDTHLERRGIGMYDMSTGYGSHEIIVESPYHNRTMANMSEREIEEVLWAYRDRILEQARNPEIKYAIIFKNYGPEAGASLEHPHSQLIALPVVPKRVLEEYEGARDYFAYKERCPYCDIIRQDKSDGERVIYENDLFIALAPFASPSPYEVDILPKQHASTFEKIGKVEIMELSKIFKVIFLAISKVLSDPPYNFILHNIPFRGNGTEFFHWHFNIVPRITKLAGFELGSGFYINPVKPEDAARTLREEINSL
ncbi:MAG TPA: galactose-1-phosphate uridylyltransferase [bacterium]|nr:galactose-1-phosphate uridylyltransferase [bacterium]